MLHKSAIRTICNNLSSRDSSREYFKGLKIFTLAPLYIFETTWYCDSKCDIIRGQDIHFHNTRSKTVFRLDNHRLQIYGNLPVQTEIKLLNQLPNDVKCLGLLP